MASSEPLVVVDLFCGAGGFSTGAALACEDLGRTPGEDVELHAVNHWNVAVESHEANHPWAEQYHAGIEELNPPDVAEPGSVDLMVAGPECTHFSSARGGEPVNEQKRAPAFHVLDWVFKLRPKHVLLENVKEFRSWGSLDDGEPTRDGEVFDQWLGVIESLGYAVDDDVLNAADYGDPTSRRRLFVVASRTKKPSYPEPTHAENPGPDDDREPWRPAADIIDWSDLGGSLWTRDLENPRVQPLAENTMERIAEGIRRHCGDRFHPLADALATVGPDSLEELRESVVPFEYAQLVADALDEPFLVHCSTREQTALTAPYLLGQHSNSIPRHVDERPAPTVATGGNIHLCNPAPFVLRQQSGGVPAPVLEDPLPTISAGGAIALTEPVGRSLIMPKNGVHRGLHSNPLYRPEDQPLHTVTSDPRAKLVTAVATPFINDYEGPPDDIDDPLGTITSRDRFALCVPEAWPWGLDVRYRMLKPSELKQAQGFTVDYHLAGDTMRDVTEQIGNAVPVHLAKALCKHVLGGADPSLGDFAGGVKADPDAGVPDYDEVIGGD